VFHAAAGGNLSMLRSYFQGDDPILGQDPNAPGQALAVNVTTANTTCAGNVATTTIPVDASATGRGIVALQGKPRVVSVANSTQLMSVRVPTPTREWVVGTGALPTAQRREIADTGACLKCHVGSLYQHGGNRVDNVDMCVLCHNSASNEKNVRVGMGVTASEAYDGLVGQTYEFKTMLHAIHSAGIEGQKPIVIYRNRGLYAWATDVSLLPNWASAPCEKATPTTTPEYRVFGGDPALDVSCQPHTFHSPTYPREINDCAACHVSGFDVMVDQAQGMATTLDAGATPWNNQLDDTLQGANTAACTSCHQDTPSVGHANQNGWVPAVFPNGRQTIIDAAD
jgi:OmcA/MtrC family decaheme c-type cytochrome